jgi:molybdate transport system substrate-binding protein
VITRPLRRPAVLASLLLVAVACSSSAKTSTATTPTTGVATTGATPTTAAATTTTAPALSGSLNVFAAASLTGAFNAAKTTLGSTTPGVSLTFNFAGSNTLVTQIQQGAPADVFASADQANMQKVVDAGGISGTPEVFATNSLEIIVAPGNPKGIRGLADLSASGLLYVTAGPDVPIGKYALQVFEKAGVTAPSPVSLEADVKAVVTKVTSGEVDAAIVYATDVTAAGSKAEGVAIPTAANVVATYPLGVTAEASNPKGAAAWIAFITGEEGQAILAEHGFGAP